MTNIVIFITREILACAQVLYFVLIQQIAHVKNYIKYSMPL